MGFLGVVRGKALDGCYKGRDWLEGVVEFQRISQSKDRVSIAGEGWMATCCPCLMLEGLASYENFSTCSKARGQVSKIQLGKTSQGRLLRTRGLLSNPLS